MADTKISALTAVSTLTGASELAVNEGGTSKKATVTQVVNNLQVIGQTAVKHLAADHSVSTTACTKVTDLDMALVAGTYTFKYSLVCQTATATVGLSFAINYTGTATRMNARCSWNDTGVSAALGGLTNPNATTGNIVAYTATITEATTTANMSAGFASAANVVNTDVQVTIEGTIVVTDSGNLELWHGSETATATRVEGPGSGLVVTRLA